MDTKPDHTQAFLWSAITSMVHHGSIEVVNNPAGGATFKVMLASG